MKIFSWTQIYDLPGFIPGSILKISKEIPVQDQEGIKESLPGFIPVCPSLAGVSKFLINREIPAQGPGRVKESLPGFIPGSQNFKRP